MMQIMISDHWTGFREQIERFLSLTGWTASRLAAEADVGESTISQFRTGEGGFQKRIQRKLEAVMERERPEIFKESSGTSARQPANSPIQSYGIDIDEIPVVDIRYFPLGAAEGKLREALDKARHSWHRRGAADPKDPDLHYLTIHEKIGRAEAGDELKISKAAGKTDGARVAVEFSDHVEIGE